MSQGSRHSNNRSISLDLEASHSTSNIKIDTTTLQKYVKMVKDAPSINEEKMILIKKRIDDGTYLSSGILSNMAEELVAKI